MGASSVRRIYGSQCGFATRLPSDPRNLSLARLSNVEKPMNAADTSRNGLADELCRRFGVPEHGPGLYMKGMNGAIDYGGIQFGQVYRVRNDVAGNHGGKIRQGDVLRFMGAYVFPYEDGLRLYFERPDGTQTAIEFSGAYPAAAGELDTPNAGRRLCSDYLDPIADPEPARGAALREFTAHAEEIRSMR